jgi:O-antigen ligase
MTRTLRTYVVAAGVAAIVSAANSSQGAYFSQSWGWVALAFLVPATVLTILERVRMPGRLRIAFAGFMSALAAWIALSSIWSISASASIREVERMFVYVAVALAVALVLRRGDGPGVLAGVLVGIGLVSTYAVATRLFPDRLDTYDDPLNYYRLAAPLGYWNALGILATMGIVVALGLVAHARRVLAAVVAAAVVPILVLTLYFTFSRGAWAALVIGVAVAVAVDPRRLRLLWTTLLLAIPSAFCVWYASTQSALTTEDSAPAAAVREGHRAAAALVLAVVASAAAAACARVVARRVVPSSGVRRGFAAALGVMTLVAVGSSLIAAGGPAGLQERFGAEPVGTADLNDRLFSVSGSGRSEQLRIAWDAGLERPVLGTGSGTYEYLWYERRPSLLVIRDAHSLFIETFAELGVIGLALLIATLGTLVVGAMRARRQRFVAVGLGALAAWSAASAFDWHWEMVGVTIVALLAGSVGLLASERRTSVLVPGLARLAIVVGATALSIGAVWSLVGNQALFAARDELAREELNQASKDARRARALLFWSSEPDLVLGDAAAGRGDRAGALVAYRAAVATDPRSWIAWLRLAQVVRGSERTAAYDRVRELNPLEEDLPGE